MYPNAYCHSSFSNLQEDHPNLRNHAKQFQPNLRRPSCWLEEMLVRIWAACLYSTVAQAAFSAHEYQLGYEVPSVPANPQHLFCDIISLRWLGALYPL